MPTGSCTSTTNTSQITRKLLLWLLLAVSGFIDNVIDRRANFNEPICNLVETRPILEFPEPSMAEISHSAKVAFMVWYFAAFKSMPNVSTGGV